MAALQSPPVTPASNSHEDANIPYSAEFTDSLMKIVLNPPSSSGIAVLSRRSNQTVVPGSSVRIEDTNPPQIDISELPLPLDDPRRVYESSVPGIKVTHPGGRLEGGSQTGEAETLPDAVESLSPGLRQFAQSLMRDHKIDSQDALTTYIDAEIKRQRSELMTRMAERRDAMGQNEKLDREIKQMEDQRALERKVEAMSRRDG